MSTPQQRMIIIGGKGGVGRTTVACALGVALAHRGRRTLLAHVRCKQDLGRLLGCKPVGDEIQQVEPNLWAVNMNPRAAIREMGLLVLRFRAIYRVVLENRIVRSFLRAVPALEEYSMVGKAWFHTTETIEHDEPRYHTVIFDGPATGHLISMLRIPQVILESVPEGPLTVDARKASTLLSDPTRTCIWLVTLAEEMAVSEARDLYRAATRELNIVPNRLVVNALYPRDIGYDGGLRASLDQLREAVRGPQNGFSPSAALRELAQAADTLCSRRAINDHYLGELDQHLPLPRIELPHLFAPTLERSHLDRLAERIGRVLDSEVEPLEVPRQRIVGNRYRAPI